MPVSSKFNDTVKKLEELAAKRIKESQQVLRMQPKPRAVTGAVKRDDTRVLENTILEQLRKIKEIEEKLKAGEELNKDDNAINKTLRLAAYNLVMDMQGLTPKQIENKLLADLNEKNDLSRESLEQDFREDVQQQAPADKDMLQLTVDPDNPNEQPDLDAALLLERGPENLPNLQGGIQNVRLYQEGNRVGVVLYSDKAEYAGTGNLLESRDVRLFES